MRWSYDPANIFARILRGEIPCKTVLESEHTLVFHDISPQAPVHVMAIPRGPYVCLDHFALEAGAEEIVDFHRTVARAVELLGLAGPGGYRAITNTGSDSGQEVPHFHLHILGGRPLGRLVAPAGG